MTEHRTDSVDDELQRELDAALGDMSLQDLVAAEDGQAPGGKSGDTAVRRGTVVAIQRDDIFVDLGGRSEGLLSSDQFRDEPLPAVGDTVEVVIDGYDESEGLLQLSREGAVQAATWENIEEGQVVEARVTGHNKGGLELVAGGIKAFMPVSQIERFRVEELDPYVNQKIECVVIEVDRREERVILSHRELLERQAEEAARKLWESIEPGQTVTGVVRNIMPYGAFVDLGGADGLLHVSDMSHGRVEDPSSVVQEGQQLKLMVLKADKDERKISLGLKQILADPWDGVEGKYPADDIVTGRITRLMDFGAFVELEPGVEGLIPISEFTFERRIRHPEEIVSSGDTVKVRVLKVEPDRRRIGLSLKRVGDDPWLGASVRFPKAGITEGIVTRIADFGAFVELAKGVEGLAHISELAHEHVRAVGDVVQEGQSVRVKVLEVDEDRRRISLSIKQAAATAPAADEGPTAPAPPKRKRRKPLKGGLDGGTSFADLLG